MLCWFSMGAKVFQGVGGGVVSGFKCWAQTQSRFVYRTCASLVVLYNRVIEYPLHVLLYSSSIQSA